jgi:hypothetical protein
MGPAPAAVDLDAVFHRLGVAVRGRAVEFDDGAPLARVRRAISGRR